MFALQTIGVICVIVALPFLPTANGRVLLIPLDRESRAQLLPRIIDSGARLIERGPIRGSFVIEGRRPRLHNVITIAAPQSGCGTAGATA